MAYTKQTWQDDNPDYPLSAARMSHIEDGIYNASTNSVGTVDPKFGGYYLDSYTGSDDERLTAAISDQQGSGGVTNMAPIILPNRPMSFNQTRILYSGLKIIGATRTGHKNPELSSGNYVGPEITLGSSLGSGSSSWWVGNTGKLFDIFMSDFSVQGSQGSSKHQFLDSPFPSSNLYACAFHNLSFNFMKGVLGSRSSSCAITGTVVSGEWTVNNLWDTQFHIAGSDSSLWMGGELNIGPSGASVQTGVYANAPYEVWLDSLGKTDVGYIFANSRNGWRGIRISGSLTSVNLFGGTYEGVKDSGDDVGPGTVMRIDGGSVAVYGARAGQAMYSPDPAEKGYIQVNGGEVALRDLHFYGGNLSTVNAIEHTGGRLTVANAMRVPHESWTNRPKVATTAPSASTSTTATYTYDSDYSVEKA